jgi:hypothetical protein
MKLGLKNMKPSFRALFMDDYWTLKIYQITIH